MRRIISYSIAIIVFIIGPCISAYGSTNYFPADDSYYSVVLESAEPAGQAYTYEFSITADINVPVDTEAILIRMRVSDMFYQILEPGSVYTGACGGAARHLDCWIRGTILPNPDFQGAVAFVYDGDITPELFLTDCEVSPDIESWDGIEICGYDVDGDGLDNQDDNCPIVSNANQLDTDGDGVGNGCDADDDNDGIADVVDNCKLVSNPDQLNTDGDFTGDACDYNDDGDFYLDSEDNCPSVYNDQNDCDGDGIGDACDPDYDGECDTDSSVTPIDPVLVDDGAELDEEYEDDEIAITIPGVITPSGTSGDSYRSSSESSAACSMSAHAAAAPNLVMWSALCGLIPGLLAFRRRTRG